MLKMKPTNAKPKETPKPTVKPVAVKPVQKDMETILANITKALGASGGPINEGLMNQTEKLNILATELDALKTGVKEANTNAAAVRYELGNFESKTTQIHTLAGDLQAKFDSAMTKATQDVKTTAADTVNSTLDKAISGEVTVVNKDGVSKQTKTGADLIHYVVATVEVTRNATGSLLTKVKELGTSNKELSTAVMAVENEQAGINKRFDTLEAGLKELEGGVQSAINNITQTLEAIGNRLSALENRKE